MNGCGRAIDGSLWDTGEHRLLFAGDTTVQRPRLVELFERAGFNGVAQRRTFSTMFGTMAL